jgi:hypothetical protein
VRLMVSSESSFAGIVGRSFVSSEASALMDVGPAPDSALGSKEKNARGGSTTRAASLFSRPPSTTESVTRGRVSPLTSSLSTPVAGSSITMLDAPDELAVFSGGVGGVLAFPPPCPLTPSSIP